MSTWAGCGPGREPDLANRDEGSNPFGWVILGFICGVIATLGVLIVYSGGLESSDSEDEAPGVADSAFLPDEPSDAPVVAQPRAVDPSTAPAPSIAPSATPSAAPPRVAPPRGAPNPANDPQIAEDAAASGMTSRSPRN